MGMDMDNILGQIDIIKNKMSQLDQELKNTTIEGSDNEGIFTVIVNGKGKVLDLKFNFNAITAYSQDGIVSAWVDAVNTGLEKARELEKQKRMEIVGDVNLPNIPGLF